MNKCEHCHREIRTDPTEIKKAARAVDLWGYARDYEDKCDGVLKMAVDPLRAEVYGDYTMSMSCQGIRDESKMNI